MDNQVKAILSGICFGLWPLIMNKSGLKGSLSSVLMCGVSFLILLPMAIKGFDISNVNMFYGVLASVVASIGIMFFNDMLSHATPQNVSMFIVTMILFQISIPAIYYIFQNGVIGYTKAIGFLLAIIAIILINK